ncbi:MAG: PilW family protein [Halioglobus sp.]
MHNQFSRRRSQSGLSLIELLIATALGVLIVTALAELFADITRTNREMAKTNSQIENARFAMQFLRNDIMHAGYWGTHVPEFDDLMWSAAPTDVPSIIPDPCLAFASWTATAGHVDSLLGIGIQAYEDPPGTCGPPGGASLLSDKLAGTDVLVVRHAETCEAGVDANCDAVVDGQLYFQGSNCAADRAVGQLFTFSNDPNSFVETERDCSTVTGRRRFIQNIYYIRDWSVTAGDGIPTLMRSEFDLSAGVLSQRPAQALVPGIERFRIELGIDSLSENGSPIDYSQSVDWADPTNWTLATNRGDGIPDTTDSSLNDGGFLHCDPCTLDQFTNVVVVKVYLLARADESSPGYTDNKTYNLGGLPIAAFNDNFKRHVFSSTVSVRNTVARRETP